ncbi:MAG: HNH endonuclease [Dehalococcoidia bacterium]
MLTQAELKAVLKYDKTTGIFTWRVPRMKMRVGDKAGCINGEGYVNITIDRKQYGAHRLAVLYVEGYFPEETVDHKNRIRSDNRYKNLQQATFQCQNRNKSYIQNSSGVTGVCWAARAGRWMSYIMVDGKSKTLGMSEEFLEAVALRYAAEQCCEYPELTRPRSAGEYVSKNVNQATNNN